MIRYCLEIRLDGAAVIHNVNCANYDLGTLLGLGCVSDLGQFASLAETLDATKASHPHAIRCPECCQARIMQLPVLRKNTLPVAIAALSG